MNTPMISKKTTDPRILPTRAASDPGPDPEFEHDNA